MANTRGQKSVSESLPHPRQICLTSRQPYETILSLGLSEAFLFIFILME